MSHTKAEITITQAGIVGITLLVPPGLHGLREMLDGFRRSAWAFEALDVAVRIGCGREEVANPPDVRGMPEDIERVVRREDSASEDGRCRP